MKILILVICYILFNFTCLFGVIYYGYWGFLITIHCLLRNHQKLYIHYGGDSFWHTWACKECMLEHYNGKVYIIKEVKTLSKKIPS